MTIMSWTDTSRSDTKLTCHLLNKLPDTVRCASR
jgi:hypothetical protein